MLHNLSDLIQICKEFLAKLKERGFDKKTKGIVIIDSDIIDFPSELNCFKNQTSLQLYHQLEAIIYLKKFKDLVNKEYNIVKSGDYIKFSVEKLNYNFVVNKRGR